MQNGDYWTHRTVFVRADSCRIWSTSWHAIDAQISVPSMTYGWSILHVTRYRADNIIIRTRKSKEGTIFIIYCSVNETTCLSLTFFTVVFYISIIKCYANINKILFSFHMNVDPHVINMFQID